MASLPLENGISVPATRGLATTGGWPNFSGTLAGGVPDYEDWTRVEIEDGVLTDSGTSITELVSNGTYASPYATSVQVDEAVSFIQTLKETSLGWFGWGSMLPTHLFKNHPLILRSIRRIHDSQEIPTSHFTSACWKPSTPRSPA